MALVAVVGDRIIGVGRYDRQSGTDEAEVALVVRDDYQYQGIGSVLLDLLVVVARVNGIATFSASILAENRAMRGVFEGSGFAPVWEAEYETMYLRFAIAPTLASRNALALRDATRRMTQREAADSGPR